MKTSWQLKTLGEVCEVVNGGTPKTGVKEYWGNEHLWITPAEMGKRLSPYADDTARKITSQGLRDSSARLLPPNSVILSSRAPIGHLVINTKPMTTNQGCKGLVPSESLAYKYLFYFLQANVDLLNDLGSGATFKELSGSKLKEVTIPFPVRPEQQRIVAILDQAFEGIAKARANAEQNLQNARALFESHLQSVFTQRGMGWVEKKLGDVCNFENGDRGVNYPSKSIQTNSGIPFINAGHLTDDGLDFETMNYIPKQRFNLLGAGKIKADDILFCLRGSLGKCASVGNLNEGAIASSLVIIRTKETVKTDFLLAYLRSHLCAQMIAKYSNGAAQPNLSAQSLKQFLISIPPYDSQESIISRLSNLRQETQRLEALYQRKIECLD